MRYFLDVSVLVAFMSYATSAAAGTAECATIDDYDARMLCFALETRNSSYCSFIKDSDKKTFCRMALR